MDLLFLGNLGTGEIIIIAMVVLLLFGGKKIPELMRGIGKGVKNFKDGVKGIEDDIKIDDTTDTAKEGRWNRKKCHSGTTWKNFVGPYSDRYLRSSFSLSEALPSCLGSSTTW